MTENGGWEFEVSEPFITHLMEKVERFETMLRHPSARNKAYGDLLAAFAGQG